MRNKNIRRKLTVTFALMLAAISLPAGNIAAAQEATPAPKPVPLDKLEMQDVDPALWVVKDDDTTIYLFGTVHVLRPGLGWFDEAVKAAFDKSDKLVLEIVEPPVGQAQKIFGKYAVDTNGKTIRSKLKGKDLDNYEAAMKKLGMPVNGFDPLDPWAAATTIQVLAVTKSGYDLNQGVEKQLTAAAKAAGKPIGALETMDQQLKIFDSLPQEDQLLFLNASTADFDAITSGLDLMVDAWGTGEADRLGNIMNAGMTSPELKAALLTRRNAHWAHWVKARLDKPGTIFMAVGAGHLSGSVSLQNLLTAYGIKADRVNY